MQNKVFTLDINNDLKINSKNKLLQYRVSMSNIPSYVIIIEMHLIVR